jgi:hypothetical protein
LAKGERDIKFQENIVAEIVEIKKYLATFEAKFVFIVIDCYVTIANFICMNAHIKDKIHSLFMVWKITD